MSLRQKASHADVILEKTDIEDVTFDSYQKHNA